MSAQHAVRARTLVGIRFRLQGRDLDGLDCVGMALHTYDIPIDAARRNYRLRGQSIEDATGILGQYFRPVRKGRAGDLMLLAPAADQLHFGVKTDAGFVHAHAGLRRLVETPGEPAMPLIGMYRRRKNKRT